MHNATSDAVAHGFPPGHETPFLQIGMTDQELFQRYSSASQPLIFQLQWQIKQMLDPNDIGDRLYTYLPGKSE